MGTDWWHCWAALIGGTDEGHCWAQVGGTAGRHCWALIIRALTIAGYQHR
ncbi:unnamed protein product [Staurois parvus]|uniref:Uncharacterized protein n=1 Tax=Staurois parvus TaxID=386267 RepID=A0ABN9CPP3_9NEOB|nr:unnamed protein product [Staurois parvus]